MTFAIEALTDAEVLRELADLQSRFTDADFDDLERHLKLRAACLHWTDPLKQPPRAVLTCVRLVVEAKQAFASLNLRLTDLALNGFWFCHDCASVCERIEGEQGQPAHCKRCRSHRIEWNRSI